MTDRRAVGDHASAELKSRRAKQNKEREAEGQASGGTGTWRAPSLAGSRKRLQKLEEEQEQTQRQGNKGLFLLLPSLSGHQPRDGETFWNPIIEAKQQQALLRTAPFLPVVGRTPGLVPSLAAPKAAVAAELSLPTSWRCL